MSKSYTQMILCQPPFPFLILQGQHLNPALGSSFPPPLFHRSTPAVLKPCRKTAVFFEPSSNIFLTKIAIANFDARARQDPPPHTPSVSPSFGLAKFFAAGFCINIKLIAPMVYHSYKLTIP